MPKVGVKELKNHLSNYIKKVKGGETLIVTDRGKAVVYMAPIGQEDLIEDISQLIKEDLITWKGGKPRGNPHPPSIKGKTTSKIVLENRR